jgi:antitoxin Phd
MFVLAMNVVSKLRGAGKSDLEACGSGVLLSPRHYFPLRHHRSRNLACGALYPYWWSYMRRGTMKKLQLKDATETPSTAVDRAVTGEPAAMIRHGRKVAVSATFEEWERGSKAPTFAELLLAFPGEPGDIPNRRHKIGGGDVQHVDALLVIDIA